MKKIFNILMFTLLIALVLASCRQRDVPEPDLDGINLRVNFKTPIPSTGGSQTKADADLENDISSVYLFLINKDSDQVYSIVKGTNIASGSSTNSRTFKVLVTFGADSHVDSKYYCYVVTNIDLVDAEIAAYKGYSYAELSDKLIDDFTQTSVTNDIVMWGMTRTDDAFTRENAPTTLDITLLRAVARVDVGLGKLEGGIWTGKNQDGNDYLPFILKSVHMYRANDKYSYMPNLSERDIINTGLNLSLAYDPIVGTPSNIGESLLANDATEKKHQHIIAGNESGTLYGSSIKSLSKMYIPEANVKQSGSSYDINHENRCAIIVGGFYAGASVESYYRVDFNEGNRGALIDVLRNRQYILTITDILSAGYTTRDEAYASRAVNMAVEILTWNSSNSDILFDVLDPMNWVHIESKSLIIGGVYGGTGALNIESSQDFENWEMAWSDTGVEIDPNVYTTATKIDCPDFFVEKSKTSLKFTCRSDNIPTQIDKTLHIRIAHRLEFKIALSQLPYGYTIEDWENNSDNDFDADIPGAATKVNN